MFPGISFTVETKADSKFKIVGAASVAAKVTRDACVDGWVFEEDSASATESLWSPELGSGYPSGAIVFFFRDARPISHTFTGQTRRHRLG
jgi:ribonuclease HII